MASWDGSKAMFCDWQCEGIWESYSFAAEGTFEDVSPNSLPSQNKPRLPCARPCCKCWGCSHKQSPCPHGAYILDRGHRQQQKQKYIVLGSGKGWKEKKNRVRGESDRGVLPGLLLYLGCLCKFTFLNLFFTMCPHTPEPFLTFFPIPIPPHEILIPQINCASVDVLYVICALHLEWDSLLHPKPIFTTWRAASPHHSVKFCFLLL